MIIKVKIGVEWSILMLKNLNFVKSGILKRFWNDNSSFFVVSFSLKIDKSHKFFGSKTFMGRLLTTDLYCLKAVKTAME